MIIWYSANFMPVVKKQSHLCVTSIIITSGLFITMNNEHPLCLWQCSQFHKLILCKFWRTFVWSSAVLLCVRIKPCLKCQNYFYPMVRQGVSLHCAAVTKMLGVTTCHVSATCRAARHNTDQRRHQQHSSHQERHRCQVDRGPSTPTSITSTVHSHIMVHLSEQMIKLGLIHCLCKYILYSLNSSLK